MDLTINFPSLALRFSFLAIVANTVSAQESSSIHLVDAVMTEYRSQHRELEQNSQVLEARYNRLMQLRERGFVSWRELGQERVRVFNLRSRLTLLKQHIDDVAELMAKVGKTHEGAIQQNHLNSDHTRRAGGKYPSAPNRARRIDDHWCAELLSETIQVATAQAQASGELHAMQARGRRSQKRMNALSRLHASGHATRQELESEIREHEQVNREIKQLQGRQHRMAELANRLRSSAGPVTSHRVANLIHRDDSTGCPMTVPNKVLASSHPLPDTFLGDKRSVEHLLLLLHLKLEAEVRCRTGITELQFLHELEDKLKKIAGGCDVTQRELEFVRIDVEYVQGRIRSAIEQSDILGLEERRFIHQSVHHLQPVINSKTQLLTSMNHGDSEVISIEEDERFSESLCCGIGVSSVMSLGNADMDDFCMDRFRVGSDSNYLSVSTSRSFLKPRVRPRRRKTRTQSDHLSGLQASVKSLRQSSSTLGELRPSQRVRFRTPSYSDCYSFGIKKPSSPKNCGMGRANSYVGPWYLPGAPTNFR